MAYYKVRMLNNNDIKNIYHVYVSAYNKAEAKVVARYEQLDYEREDIIDAIIEISEKEYEIGYKKYGDGIRE